MKKDSDSVFELCEQTAKIYGSMVLGALINDAQCIDSTQQHAEATSALANLKNQISLAISIRDSGL